MDDRDFEAWNQGKVTWQVSYQRSIGQAQMENKTQNFTDFGRRWMDQYKVRARIDINKDDVQQVLPVAKVRIKS